MVLALVHITQFKMSETMRLCDLFPRIKEASLEKESIIDKDRTYTLLRFIIRHRRAIGLEDDRLITMYDKCKDVMRYLETYTQHHKGMLDDYKMTFLSLLALTMDIIEADQCTKETVVVEKEEQPSQKKRWKTVVVFILVFVLWIGINGMLLKRYWRITDDFYEERFSTDDM